MLLADAGVRAKTIMSGLLIMLTMRGDVARCLIVPGSLVGIMAGKLWERFGLDFDMMSPPRVAASVTCSVATVGTRVVWPCYVAVAALW